MVTYFSNKAYSQSYILVITLAFQKFVFFTQHPTVREALGAGAFYHTSPYLSSLIVTSHKTDKVNIYKMRNIFRRRQPQPASAEEIPLRPARDSTPPPPYPVYHTIGTQTPRPPSSHTIGTQTHISGASAGKEATTSTILSSSRLDEIARCPRPHPLPLGNIRSLERRGGGVMPRKESMAYS